MSGDGDGPGDGDAAADAGIGVPDPTAAANVANTAATADPMNTVTSPSSIPAPYGQAPSATQSLMDEEAATVAAIQSDTEEPMGFLEALEMGRANAQARFGNVNTIGSLISGAAGLGAALGNAPAGSMAHPQGEIATDVGSEEVASTSGEGISVAGGAGEPGNAGEAGGPSEEELRDDYPIDTSEETIVTPLPEVVDAAPSDAAPEMASTNTSTGATAAAEEPAPMVSPLPASSAPGTLIRRRRRTPTILTSPQGVLGGAVSTRAGRRTRSLPRKTLLGG